MVRKFKISNQQLYAVWSVDYSLITANDLLGLAKDAGVGGSKTIDQIIHAYLISQMHIPMTIRYDGEYDEFTDDLPKFISLVEYENPNHTKLTWNIEGV